jgi:mRNA interferase ChpB
MDRGEIWLVSLDPIAGHEQSGKRPVLIVSKASFNKLTRLPLLFPSPAAEILLARQVSPFHWKGQGQKQRALFAATSPEPLIWLPGTASGWNAYQTLW